MSSKTRLAKLEITHTENKSKAWLWNKSPVGETPGPICGIMVRCEKAARGQIPFDTEIKDELAWLDAKYKGESSFGYCSGYLDYCDKFIADFELGLISV